jgi:muramoyltetrapeptide carboxypeptidase
MSVARQFASCGVRPPALLPGDRVALVAPASPFEPEKLDRVYAYLEQRDLQPVVGRHCTLRQGYLAGPEAGRCEDLITALRDPEIAAILCMRGGYGSGRLLPHLPFASFKRQPKIFLGYSDITFLHLAFWKNLRWVTFHGPNLVELDSDTTGRGSAVLSGLQGEREFLWRVEPAQVLRGGAASGILLGGNLTCITHSLMTPFFPDLQGSLLMLEDRGEALYRLDRKITQLRLAGIFERISGLILGEFLDCGNIEDVWQMIVEQVRMYAFPVVAGLPFGHGGANDLLPLGLPYALNTHEAILRAEQHPFAA